MLGDDDSRVPGKNLVARDPRELAGAEPGGNVDNPCLVDRRHCLRAGEPGFEAVGPAAVINQGSRGRFGDQQPAAQIVDRRPHVMGEVLPAFADTEHCPDDLQRVSGPLDAAVEDDVGNLGLLLDRIGECCGLRRHDLRSDDQIGMQPGDRVGHRRRVRPGEVADDRQARELGREKGALLARQRSAPADELLRRQYEDEHRGGLVGRHHPPNPVGHRDIPLGGIDKVGSKAVRGKQ